MPYYFLFAYKSCLCVWVGGEGGAGSIKLAKLSYYSVYYMYVVKIECLFLLCVFVQLPCT